MPLKCLKNNRCNVSRTPTRFFGVWTGIYFMNCDKISRAKSLKQHNNVHGYSHNGTKSLAQGIPLRTMSR